MLKVIIALMKMIFSLYFVGLTVICGLFLSFVYPMLISDPEFKTEYKIGRIAGYIYIAGSIFFLIITKLFG
ncbi:MAG TPA: hypothetical protein GX505_09060 [Clostridiales bacterium]|nr:hypothetical protein [Clostridiales bacterium]